MQYEWITVIGIAFIFLANTLGALFAFFFHDELPKVTQSLFFGFAGGVMIAASVWSLLIPAMEQNREKAMGFSSIAIAFLCGGVLILLLDGIIVWLRKGEKWSSAQKLCFAVTLHNIPEGLAVGFAFGVAHLVGSYTAYIAALGLAIGIGVQNMPEGMAVALSAQTELKNSRLSFRRGFLSGAIEPLFAVIGYYFAGHLPIFQPLLLAFSAGAMIYVTVEELLPDIGRGEHVRAGAWSFMFGFVCMMALDVVLG